MKKKDEMLSVGEILKSEKFQRAAPEGFGFQLRKTLTENRQAKTQSVNKSKKKIVRLAK